MGKKLRILIKTSLVMAVGCWSLPAFSQDVLKPLPQSSWYNCLTREVWTESKKVWCDRQQQLKNAQYILPDFGAFKLTQGEYKNNSQRKVAVFADIPGTVVTGKIGSRPNLTTAILSTNTGGSGMFYYLVLTDLQTKGNIVLSSAFLGDRVQVKSVTLDKGEVQVRLIQQGDGEPQCCPTQEVVQTYLLEKNQLKKVKEKIVGTVPLDPGNYGFNPLELPTNKPLIGDNPLKIAQNLYGVREVPSEGRFKEEIILIDRIPDHPVVIITQTGLLDDSLEGRRYRLEFVPQGQQWRLISVGEQNLCRPGRGEQDWTNQLCS